MTVGLAEIGEAVMSAAQARLEVVSRNIANATTPGYRSATAFQIALERAAHAPAPVSVTTNYDAGAMQASGGAWDFALSGPGFFMLRGESETYFTRGGQFERTADGRLVNAQGFALQTTDGADVVVELPDAEVLADGTILENGTPVTRVGVFSIGEAPLAIGGALFSADNASVEPVPDPIVRHGMLELSNVDTADEMVAMMASLRMAEIGARIIQTYDSLIEQSIATWGRSR